MKKFRRKVLDMLMSNNSGSSLRQQLLDGAPFCSELLYTAIPQRAASGTTATFTRATTATVQNNDGYLVTALAGEARFEGARRVRNLMVASENFTGAAWTEGRATLSANSTTAPNGTTTATTITSNSALAVSHFLIDDNTLVPSNEFRLYSIHVKPSTHNYVALNIQGGVGNYVTKVFDLANGVVGETFVGGTSGTLSNASITSVGSGWFRISMMAKITSAGIRNFVVFFASAATGNTINTTGDINIASAAGTEDFYLWGAQLEDVTAQTTQTAGEYVSVGVESAPYYHGSMVDGVKCFPTDLSGNPIPSTTLLGYRAEGARTNLCLQSQTFPTAPWSAARVTIATDNIAAPDGTTTAERFTADAGTATSHLLAQSGGPVVSATTQTHSIYVKTGTHNYVCLNIQGTAQNFVSKVFDLSTGTVGETKLGTTSGTLNSSFITDVGNGWYRIGITGQITSGGVLYVAVFFAQAATGNTFNTYGDVQINTAGTETLYLWGAQSETGSFASSYIATTTIAVARNADVLTYSSAGNILGTAGWCYAEITTAAGQGTNQNIVSRSPTVGTNGVPLYIETTNTVSMYDGTGVATKAAATRPYTTPQKVASTWGGSTMATAQNGVVGTPAAFDGDMSLSASVCLGSDGGIANLFGTMRNVRLGQRLLSTSEEGAITA